jgi:hypothetical protein
MATNIKFYKLKFIKEFNECCDRQRQTIMQELIDNATDPVVFKRRIRMLEHLAEYQVQIYKKLETFETDDPYDYQCIPLMYNWRPKYPPEATTITHRGA